MTGSLDSTDRELLLANLGRLDWTKGIGDEALRDLGTQGEFLKVDEGEVLHRAGHQLEFVYFVTNGRLHATIADTFDRVLMERTLIRGGVFGLFSVNQTDQSGVTITAKEPTSVFRLNFEQLHRLSAKYEVLQLNLYRLAGSLVRRLVMVDRTRPQPSTVAVVHQSDATRCLTRAIVLRLRQIEKVPCVASDDDGDWKSVAGIAYTSLKRDGQLIGKAEAREQIDQWSSLGRIFIDLSARWGIGNLIRTMIFADSILWCIRPEDALQAQSLLGDLENQVPGWREKICLVWLLGQDSPIPPSTPDLTSLVDRTFKISLSPPDAHQGPLLSAGLERIVHYLRGIRIGIALGGGAARGMAHLGVLKSLERNGIHIDMIAGTSAGAMTGVVYAFGMDPDYATECFHHDLQLPWLFRQLPAGGYWYLLYKYRRGQFDPMLREYLGDTRLQQLMIPTYTITVDLVRGVPVVRDQGDAVRSIIESINVPGLASPIVGEDHALVDGGLVNNIPADVLVNKGCNFVIASSVTAKLEEEFGGIRIDKSTQGRKRNKPSTLKALLRGQLVQSVNMNAVGVQPADFVIEPDVTQFDLSEFGRTRELAAAGEAATTRDINSIKHMLSKLDSKLFPPL